MPFTSFSTALSALSASATAVDVTGNNLANLNTPGFKTSVVEFRDLVTQSLGAGLGETQVGFGTGTPLTVRQFSQGALQSTSGTLDAAIQGDGFFVLRDAGGGLLLPTSWPPSTPARPSPVTERPSRWRDWPIRRTARTSWMAGATSISMGIWRRF